MNNFLNILYHILHILIIVVNLFGWVFRRTRKINLAILVLTLFSWFGLGIFYGLGYCPITHWHWNLKRSMGEVNLPHSYIKLMFDNLTGYDWNPQVIDVITFASFFVALGISCFLNYKDYKKRK